MASSGRWKASKEQQVDAIIHAFGGLLDISGRTGAASVRPVRSRRRALGARRGSLVADSKALRKEAAQGWRSESLSLSEGKRGLRW